MFQFTAISFVICLLANLLNQVAAQNGSVALPYELTYLLPNNFSSDISSTFANGTTTSNDTINQILSTAKQSLLISYDKEFTDIFPRNPRAEVVINWPRSRAFFEAGVWLPDLAEVWFASRVAVGGQPSQMSVLNLTSNTVRNVSIPYVNGATYSNGKIYVARYAPAGDIVSVDPATSSITTVLNSYFGLSFNFIDDLVWVHRKDRSYLFFTQVNFAPLLPGLRNTSIPNTVWRFDPHEKLLLPVIGSTDFYYPNGIRVSPDQHTLYITDTSTVSGLAPGGAPHIYAYTLDDNVMPIDKRVFGLVRTGFADGIHVDDRGRVWTAEGEGIVVRRSDGKILGVVNSQVLGVESVLSAIANFALAGNVLVIGGGDKLYKIQLAQTVVTKGSTLS